MIKRIEACDFQRVDDYLDGTLSESESGNFETHLSSCETCRALLEEHSAEPEVWDNARELLGTGELDTSGKMASDSKADGSMQPSFGVLDSLAPTDDPEMLGRMGEYEIGGVVGVGGMGAVLRGFDKSLRRVVAIKVMAPHLAGSGPARTRFQREARAAAAITHDNVIDIYGVAEAGGLPYLVMPYARGPSLQKRIDESGPLGVLEVIRIGKQIASGLAAAHEQGLVHRDIKPANILLNEGIERLWITDFGVARAMDDVSMTKTGVITGTPQYMSPEQARGENVDQRSDLFSLGSILYTACTGRPPFRSEGVYGILRRITDTDPRPIREVNAEIPEWLSRLISRLMAKHPSDRFQSAAEVADLLENCIAHIQQPTHVELPGSLTATELSLADANTGHSASQSPSLTEPTTVSSNRSLSLRKLGVTLMLSLVMCFAAGLVALEVTEPPNLDGTWQGERWQDVTFSSTPEAPGWYSGRFEDNQGNRGVLHLEWSRIQRRYNGRWRVGQDQSGPITLRNQDGNLRGAVSFDANSTAEASMPRLRDFSWQRGAAAKNPFEQSSNANSQSSVKRGFEIYSPKNGIVSHVSDRLKLAARVEKGQLLATILRKEDTDELQTQLDAMQQELKDLKKLESAKIGELDIAERSLEAEKKRLNRYLVVKGKVDEVTMAKRRTAKARLDQAESELAQSTQAVGVAELELKTAQRASESGLLSSKGVDIAEEKLLAAKRQVEAGEGYIESAKLAIGIEEEVSQDKLREAISEFQDATADRNAAETEVARTITGLAEVRAKISAIKRDAQAIQRRLSELQRIQIMSPVDGVITQLDIVAVGQQIKEGERLIAIEISESNSPSPSVGNPPDQTAK